MENRDLVDELRVRQIVRRVVEESLGEGTLREPSFDPEASHDTRVPEGPGGRPAAAARIHLAPGTELTAEIQELASRRDAEIVDEDASGGSSGRSVAIGSDHAGYPLKESLKAYLAERGYQVDDCGT